MALGSGYKPAQGLGLAAGYELLLPTLPDALLEDPHELLLR